MVCCLMAPSHYLNQFIINRVLYMYKRPNSLQYATQVNCYKFFRNYEIQNHSHIAYSQCINTLRLKQNGHLFADDTLKRIFLNENIRISIKISLKFVPKGLINNIPALVLIMAWCRPGDKPLSEPMMVRSLAHICVTRPQWVNIQNYSPYFIWNPYDNVSNHITPTHLNWNLVI